MTAPALNAAISIHEKINGTTPAAPSHPSKVNGVNGLLKNGVNGVNGHHHHDANGHHAQAESIVKEAPFNTGRGRPLRVVCIGAGAAGICLGLKLPRTISPELCELQVRLAGPYGNGKQTGYG